MRRGDTPETADTAVSRHLEHFNSHPYLATMGIGAVARLEAEGTDPQRIAHFKSAIRGPLGGLGDRLVWVGWLPAIALAGVLATALGVSWIWIVFGALIMYNALHLGLRTWSFNTGYASGFDLARSLKGAGLDRGAEALSRLATVLLGMVVGLAAVKGFLAGVWWWAPAGVTLFFVGNRGRRRGWGPVVAATASLIAAISLIGALG